jgi:hypothetical protein
MIIAPEVVRAGDNIGKHLNGLTTQATAFNASLLGSVWNRLDVIARAIQQAEAAIISST